MGYLKWTDEMNKKFIQMYSTCSMDEIMKEFPISRQGIISKANQLQVKRNCVKNSNYTEEEDTILINGIENNKTIAEIQQDIPWRSICSIQSRLGRISKKKRQYWTDEEENLLKNIYEILPLDETVQMFPNRTRTAIILHAEKLGLHAYVDTKYYSIEENEFIRNNYQIMSDKEISDVLNRSVNSIKNHRVLMGIYREQKGNTNYENAMAYIRKHNQQWKKDSMDNCGFSCVITGERFDEIHHLVSLNTILKNVYIQLNLDEKEFDINKISNDEKLDFLNCVLKEQSKYPLGVCLRKDIHTKFHNQYGYGNNTVEQFEDFMHNNYPNIKLNIS